MSGLKLVLLAFLVALCSGCGGSQTYSEPLMEQAAHSHYHVHAVDASHGHTHADGEQVGHVHTHEHAPL